MKKFRLLLLTLFIFKLFILPAAVFSESEFSADYDVTYRFSENGSAVVSQAIFLTNLKPDIYPKQYSIIVDAENIRDVTAGDPSGAIIPQVLKSGGKTQILLTFNKRVVGIGKKLEFNLNYHHPEIARKNGTIWEIDIPGIAESADLGTYRLKMDVPDSFGPVAYQSPMPREDGSWTKDQLLSGGINAAYGVNQFFTLDLKYYLDNPTNNKKVTDIALPPDTAFQKINIESLDPKPLEIKKDDDGNWLASYSVKPEENLEIKAKIRVLISLTPFDDYHDNTGSLGQYLRETANWPVTFPQITQLSKNLKSAQEIYDYVVRMLDYDYERVLANPVRKGALNALSEPASSLCTEFTDLFVTLARSTGIPARQVIGYAYTTNAKLRPLSLVTDVLHAWPEYYDRNRKIWIPVDPTWGKTTGGVDYFTKLDFNHIVFAINGLRDDYPYPAGSYRQPGTKGKILEITFADSGMALLPEPLYEVEITFPKTIAAGIKAKGTVAVRNISGVSANNVLITITTRPDNRTVEEKIDQIPPFTTREIPVFFTGTGFMASGQGSVTASVNGISATVNFGIRPIHAIIMVTLLTVLVVFFSLWIGLKHIRWPKPGTAIRS